MKSLLKRLYTLASHPSAAKRLGASLTVNRIYRIFREEESLVDQFTFELMYWILLSLRLANGDHEALGKFNFFFFVFVLEMHIVIH